MKYINEKQCIRLNSNNLKSKTCAIQEDAVYGHTEKIRKYTNGKVKFNAILQTCGETNQNKRVYTMDVMRGAVDRIQESLRKKNFVGELDHPITTNQTRQTTVLYKECSHVITNLEFRGSQLWGEIETLPYTPNGKILSGLVLDNVTIGFSMRGLADLEDNGSYQKVLSPLIMICYDSVQNPSHKKASVQEIHQESIKVLAESANLIRTDEGKCYLPNLFDELIERKLITLHENYVRRHW